MFDLSIEDNRDVSWGSMMSWAERSRLPEVSKIKMSFTRSPKASRAFRASLPYFEGNETEQNRTQRQQSIEGLRKLSKAKLLEI
jgi:hypothetical protein